MLKEQLVVHFFSNKNEKYTNKQDERAFFLENYPPTLNLEKIILKSLIVEFNF